MDRRNFIKTTAITSAGLGVLSSTDLFAQSTGKIKIVFIGVGLRGRNHVQIAINRDDLEIVAVCDIQEESLAQNRKLFQDAGKKLPKEYTGSADAYKKMFDIEKPDAVIIATPWECHYQQAMDAMKAKIAVGCEVIAGLTVKEHWDIVKTSEQTGTPYMTLENVAFRRDVLAMLNMHRQGLFGELLHLEGGYQHDLREVLFNDGKHYYGHGAEFGPKAISEAQWRTKYNVDQDGDLYPTHGLGPIMKFADINHGNRFTRLTSYSSKARGLASYVNKIAPGHPNAKLNYKNGDVTQTMLQCANGETMMITHDTHLPRPYSIGFRIQGTEGLWMDVAKGVHIEGKSKPHTWDPVDQWVKEYDHPIWKKYETLANGSGHGGMDWFVFNAFIQSVKLRVQPPIDVYDSVTMSVLFPLSTESLKQGNKTLDFPDFTNGKWKNRKNTFMLDDSGM